VKNFPDRLFLISPHHGGAAVVESSILLDPIGWAPDSGRFHVSIAGRLIVAVEPNSEEFETFQIPGDGFTFARLSADRLLSMDDLVDQFSRLNEFVSHDKSGAKRTFIFLGNHPIGVRFNPVNLRVELSQGDVKEQEETGFFALRNLQAIRTSESLLLVSLGNNYDILDKSDPYLNTLIDREDGEPAGFFGPKALFGSDGSKQEIEVRPDEFIVNVDKVGESVAILLESFDGGERVLFGKIGALNEYITCSSNKTFLPSDAQNRASYQKIDVGKFSIGVARHAIAYARFFSNRGERGRVTIVFHGGPLETAVSYFSRVSSSFEDYACGDVILIDGTGSVGGGIEASSSAARLGFEAFKLDATAARDLARSLGYKDVSVVGNSFGGISGTVASTIDWPELRTVSLVAPALSLLPPEQISRNVQGSGQRDRVNIDGLSGFYQFVYGENRDEISSGIASALRNPDSRLHIYLGTNDRRVPIELLPPSFPKQQMTVIEGGTHASVFRNLEVSTSVKERVCGVPN
jgi:pimeloyl-ACP methyl ester carboxylesterase